VVDGREQHRGTRAVGDVAGVLGHLQGDDVLALAGLADHDQLGHALVGGCERGHLVLDAAGLRVGAEHVVERVRRVAAGLGLRERARAGVRGGELLGDLRLGDVRARSDLLEAEALGARLLRLGVDQVDEDRLRPVLGPVVAGVAEVDAEVAEHGDLLVVDGGPVHLQRVREGRGRGERHRGEQYRYGQQAASRHEQPPSWVRRPLPRGSIAAE
jgi:hypothetical protein